METHLLWSSPRSSGVMGGGKREEFVLFWTLLSLSYFCLCCIFQTSPVLCSSSFCASSFLARASASFALSARALAVASSSESESRSADLLICKVNVFRAMVSHRASDQIDPDLVVQLNSLDDLLVGIQQDSDHDLVGDDLQINNKRPQRSV
jgi:hypothetical protein